MELREPPRRRTPPKPDVWARGLLAILVVLTLVLLGLTWSRRARAGADLEATREVASKLLAAGAVDEASALYGRLLESGGVDDETRARIAYSLGTNYLESGRYDTALRWLYEAETLGAEGLEEEIGQKIVHCLERLGRSHSADAALAARVDLGNGEEARRGADDPVVARIGDQEVYRSEVRRTLDQMPPDVAQQLGGPEGRAQLLERYVAEELVWRKAVKLEYDRDPEVLRQLEAATRQLVIARFLEQELAAGIEVDAADLTTFFTAHRERYSRPGEDGEEIRPELAEIRPVVERDYRLYKMQAAYEELIRRELVAADIELHPERMGDD